MVANRFISDVGRLLRDSLDFDVSAIDEMAIRRSYHTTPARTMVVRHKDWNAALAAATGETTATLESLCLDAFLGQ